MDRVYHIAVHRYPTLSIHTDEKYKLTSSMEYPHLDLLDSNFNIQLQVGIVEIMYILSRLSAANMMRKNMILSSLKMTMSLK